MSVKDERGEWASGKEAVVRTGTFRLTDPFAIELQTLFCCPTGIADEVGFTT